MTLTDARFGVELVSEKGKIFVFDDTGCLQRFVKNEPATAKGSAIYLAVFNPAGSLVQLEKSFLLISPDIHGPMNGQIAAFSSQIERQTAQKNLGGKTMEWKELLP
jgi:copper chaperone NosL